MYLMKDLFIGPAYGPSRWPGLCNTWLESMPSSQEPSWVRSGSAPEHAFFRSRGMVNSPGPFGISRVKMVIGCVLSRVGGIARGDDRVLGSNLLRSESSDAAVFRRRT